MGRHGAMKRVFSTVTMVGLSVAWGLTLAGCARSVAAVQPATGEDSGATPGFHWFVDLDGQRQALRPAIGDLDLGLDGWFCGYQVDPVQSVDSTLSQFGKLACEHLATGKMVDTLVLCKTAESRPTDHGSGSLIAVVGEQWPGRHAALTCSSVNPPGERPTVQLPADPRESTVAGGGLGMRTAAEDGTPRASAESVNSDDAMSLEFVWQVLVADPGRSSHEHIVTERHGTLDHGLDGWSCSYAVNDVPSSSGLPAEAGSLVCDSGEGVVFTTAVACAPTPDDPRACQAGSLRFSDGHDGVRSLMISCWDPAHPSCGRADGPRQDPHPSDEGTPETGNSHEYIESFEDDTDLPGIKLQPLPDGQSRRKTLTYDLDDDGVPEVFVENNSGANTVWFTIVDQAGTPLLHPDATGEVGGHRIDILASTHDDHHDIVSVTYDIGFGILDGWIWVFDGRHYVKDRRIDLSGSDKCEVYFKTIAADIHATWDETRICGAGLLSGRSAGVPGRQRPVRVGGDWVVAETHGGSEGDDEE